MKYTTIYINGKPFSYLDEDEDISYANIKPITHEDAKSLLETTKKLFSECDIFFFLAFGTLLGAVRDHNIIDGDEDVDIFVFDEEKLRQSLPKLQDGGLHLCRIQDNSLYSFKLGANAFIDVYILKPTPHGLWYKWCLQMAGRYYPKWYFAKFDTIPLLGSYYPAPHKPERLFMLWYGKTWKIPIRGHKIECEELFSHYWWKTKGYHILVRVIHRIKHPLYFHCK